MNKLRNKPMLSIGIPAFNEEANIYYLLSDLFGQKTDSFELEEIIIASDASSDDTVRNALKINRPELVIYDNKIRKGAAWVQNQILDKSNSDILVMLDADTKIKDAYFLEKIIKPIVKNQADLTSVRVLELRAENLLEKALEVSMHIKRRAFEKSNSGDNLYTCHGRARGFSKKLYKSFKFPESIGEDAYSYLFCIAKGFKYKYVKNTAIYFKLPATLQDHLRQSVRYMKSEQLFYKEFGREFVSTNYKWPTKGLIESSIYYLFTNPVYFFVYISILLLMKIKSVFSRVSNNWEISISSKVLVK